MKYVAKYSNQFRKDFKLCIKRGYNMQLIKEIMLALENSEPLNEKNRDHSLFGNYVGYRECHIQPDWLLIYQVSESVLVFNRTGTHADLF
jgi:addiction module toxin, RelE/StbE family